MRCLAVVTPLVALLFATGCRREEETPPPPPDPLLAQAEVEIAAILAKFPSFRVVPLEETGPTVLSTADSLVVEDIRGVAVDDAPPALQGPAYTAPASMVDGFSPGEAPYEAPGILPFRFRWFVNADDYSGWHTWNMAEYLSLHGFDQHNTYNSPVSAWTHLPEGTSFYEWGWWSWTDWMAAQGYDAGRYDTLPGLGALTDVALQANFFINTRNPQEYVNTMVDLEHGVLSPTDLQAQAWYPSTGTPAEQAAFEEAYYDGFARTHMAWMRAARERGWPGTGIYGWQPFARQWFGLDTAQADPATDWRWTRFGHRIYDEVEVLYPSVYCFYWNRRNIAYVLANLDLNHAMISGEPVRKPMKAYTWPLFHGGGPGWRWWRYQPMPDDEVQALFAAIFFAPIEGVVLYGWSGTTDPHRVVLSVDADRFVETPFAAPELGNPGQTRDFVRYDVVHVTAIDASDNVEFKFIDKADPAGSLAAPTTYVLPRATLEPVLRPDTAAVDAVVEGMALARVFEFFLWHGERRTDVDARIQWGNDLPVVRRVRLGPYHGVVAYDPFHESHPGGRTVLLPDFDGAAGRSLEIPADGAVRIWILREP